jgi:predicted RNase H-like nuclease
MAARQGICQLPKVTRQLAVLGIDAAWTEGEPSGVALWEKRGERWRCMRLAPSYSAFCGDFRWDGTVTGGKADVPDLIATCFTLLGHSRLAVVAVDMPLSSEPITSRRVADNLVSQQFGARKCSVHSPTAERPGRVATELRQGFANEGVLLAVHTPLPEQALIEVYPHVALLKLTRAAERVPYKAAKSGSYWGRDVSAAARKRRLVDQWAGILARLRREADDIDLPLPSAPEELSFKHLKRYEDGIDALVCAWVATLCLKDAAIPLGDNSGAIWIPSGIET